MEAIDNLTDLVESLDQQTKPLLRKRGNQCLKAFGHQKFCSCVNVHIPIGMPFEQYIKVTISTKDELGYAGLSEQQKEIVDTVLKVREQCVKTVWGQ